MHPDGQTDNFRIDNTTDMLKVLKYFRATKQTTNKYTDNQTNKYKGFRTNRQINIEWRLLEGSQILQCSLAG